MRILKSDGATWKSDYPYPIEEHQIKVELAAADILALNATALEVIPAPGAGKVVVDIQAVAFVDFGSVAYATQTALELTYAGGTKYKEALAVLAATADLHQEFLLVSGAEDQIKANAAVSVSVPTADPTAGNSPVSIWISYKVLG